jgi:hypothetical protein
MKENFLSNYETLVTIVEKKYKMYGDDPKILKTGFYSMTVPINYNYINKKIKTIKNELDSK